MKSETPKGIHTESMVILKVKIFFAGRKVGEIWLGSSHMALRWLLVE
jgi:hypothetical protein